MVGWEEEVEVLIEKRDNASGRGSCLFGTTLPHGCVFPVWTRLTSFSSCPPGPLSESSEYSTIPRNENRLNENHLDQSLSFSQKNENSLTWVLVALTVCFTYPVLYRVSSESRAGEWEL